MRKHKVLIVDDVLNNIILVQNALEINHINSDYAKNGTEAIDMAKSNQYDCILLDIMMPGINGFEVCKTLKADKSTSDIPVIFLTASNDQSTISTAFELGGIDYIIKPFHIDEVYKRVKTHIQLHLTQKKLKKELRKNKKYQKQLKLKEKKYRSIFQNSMLAIGIVNVTGKIYEVNDAMCSFFGYTKDEMKNLNINNLYHHPKLREPLVEQLLKEGYVQDWEIDFKSKDNQLISCVLTANLIQLNNIQYIIIAISNITKQKETEKNILKAIIETEEKERSYFAQELHDGLSPILSTTKLFIQSVLDAKNIQKTEYFLKNANDSIEEAIYTLKEISNKLSPHILKNFGLTSAITSFIEKIKKTTKIEFGFKTDFSERLNQLIETTLYRIITELIQNTIKHSHASLVEIRLKKINEIITLDYYDNGIGFDIFETKQNRKGLGLFNLEHRVNTLKGDIKIQSVIGRGTRISTTIPL